MAEGAYGVQATATDNDLIGFIPLNHAHMDRDLLAVTPDALHQAFDILVDVDPVLDPGILDLVYEDLLICSVRSTLSGSRDIFRAGGPAFDDGLAPDTWFRGAVFCIL